MRSIHIGSKHTRRTYEHQYTREHSYKSYVVYPVLAPFVFIGNRIEGEFMPHKVLTSLLFVLLLIVRAPSWLSAATVTLNPGDNIQAAITANPAGTTFKLNPGRYPFQTVRPKDGNTFQGSGRTTTILTGARTLTGWTQSGSTWFVTGQTQEGWVNFNDQCADGHPRCGYPEELWINNVWKKHVDSVGAVTTGTWFFDYAADRIYVGDDPTGQAVETSVTTHAFVGGGANVTIRDLTVEKYATPTQAGAVHSWNGATPLSGWVISNCDIRQNHGNGVTVGQRTRVANGFIHHNGNLGIGGGDNLTNVEIEGNEISFNNVSQFDAGWQGGGVKLAAGVTGTVWRNNHVHDNYGPGLWCDYCGAGQLYEGNRVEQNVSMGIFHEVSADAVIRNNIVRWNGHSRIGWLYDAQILISSSWNVEVYGNKVQVSRAGGNAITIIDQGRPGGSPVKNNYIHDNLIIHDGDVGLSGAATDRSSSPIFTGNNRFVRNTYCVPSLTRSFWTWGTNKTWPEWQAIPADADGALGPNQHCLTLDPPTRLHILLTRTLIAKAPVVP
jgi:hypothetical protein